MALKQKGGGGGDSTGSDNIKKKRRVGFSNIDVGIEANECIKVYLVSKPEEVDEMNSFCIDPIDLNPFFEDAGKIYGYKDLKINIWLSTVSFHTYADIAYKSTSDEGKGITDLNHGLQNLFGESLIKTKDAFLQSFSAEKHYISSVVSKGRVIQTQAFEGHTDLSTNYLEPGASNEEDHVICMNLSSTDGGQLYSRLVPLVLLLVDGSRPIDIADPRWEIYLIVNRIRDQSGEILCKLLGYATIYRFYHYPDSSRLRISQILILPPYQGRGHGRRLLETINSIAVSENAYDVTVEEPSDYLQHVRACIDTIRLLNVEPVKPAVSSISSCLKGNLSKKASKFRCDPPASLVEDARKQLKINRKQFLQCWEVLIYLSLDHDDPRCVENYRACVADRLKGDIFEKDAGTSGKSVIDVPNNYGHDMTFMMFKLRGIGATGKVNGLDTEVAGNQQAQEEQLKQLVDERMEEIVEIAEKVSLHCKSLGIQSSIAVA